MKTICIEVKDDIFTKVVNFLRLLPEDSLRIQIGDPDDIFSKEDEKAYNKAIRELQEEEAISLDQAKQELLGVPRRYL